MNNSRLKRRNRLFLGGLLLFVAGMIGISFAAVPLYQLFCQVTGFGGTPQIASGSPLRILDRKITIRLNADVSPDLSWSFKPEVKEMSLKLGQQALVGYHAQNLTDKPLTGIAIYNVTPEKTGAYFNKIQCFCFENQTLQAHQAMDMPVLFFIDPALADDPHMDDVDTITLSYTFFQAKN